MDLNLDMWAQGFAAVLQPQNGLFLLLGTCVGMVVGVMPAIGPNFGVALMLPLTFGMAPETAVIFLASIHASAAYGDSIASILINVPGGGGSVAACWDGHPMARQGKGGMALAISAFGSWAGGVGGWVAMVILSPILIAFARRIGPPEYFMIALLALSLLAIAAKGQNSKGLIMAAFGLLVAFVGQDETTGAIRFTFGSDFFENGIDLIPVVVGVFAISQLLIMAEEGGSVAQVHTRRRRHEARRSGRSSSAGERHPRRAHRHLDRCPAGSGYCQREHHGLSDGEGQRPGSRVLWQGQPFRPAGAGDRQGRLRGGRLDPDLHPGHPGLTHDGDPDGRPDRSRRPARARVLLREPAIHRVCRHPAGAVRFLHHRHLHRALLGQDHHVPQRGAAADHRHAGL